ncbi:MAG: hypothetical protein HQL30_04560 [Candidatus Omnitrophica bacterium]|nr:hypothetical protein [Candidatus Omnitrophota bacterium]
MLKKFAAQKIFLMICFLSGDVISCRDEGWGKSAALLSVWTFTDDTARRGEIAAEIYRRAGLIRDASRSDRYARALDVSGNQYLKLPSGCYISTGTGGDDSFLNGVIEADLLVREAELKTSERDNNGDQQEEVPYRRLIAHDCYDAGLPMPINPRALLKRGKEDLRGDDQYKAADDLGIRVEKERVRTALRDVMSWGTYGRLHMDSLYAGVEEFSDDGAVKELDKVSRYFTFSGMNRKARRQFTEHMFRPRWNNPLRDKNKIERSQRQVKAINELDEDTYERLTGTLVGMANTAHDYMQDIWFFRFCKQRKDMDPRITAMLVEGEPEYIFNTRDHYLTKAIIRLSFLAGYALEIKAIMDATGIKGDFGLYGWINSFLEDPEVKNMIAYTQKYPFDRFDIISSEWGAMQDRLFHARTEKRMASLLERDLTRLRPTEAEVSEFSMSRFWQYMTGFNRDFHDMRGVTLPERVNEFRPLQRSFEDVFNADNDSLFSIANTHNLVNEMLFASGGARMMKQGGYSIAKVPDVLGRVKLDKAWNPAAGKKENMDLVDIDITGRRKFLGITGENEIGKSTTAEMIAICALYNQMGLPVPAEYAELSVFRNVYVDTPSYENIKEGESTHTALVRRLGDLIGVAGPGDLVIIDEAHMGSEYKDLTAITSVLIEDLMKTGATVVYTTHLKEVMHILKAAYPDLSFKRIMPGPEGERTFEEGIADDSYAVKTLRKYSFPEKVIGWSAEYYRAVTGSEMPDPGAGSTGDKPRGKSSGKTAYDELQDHEIFKRARKALFSEKNIFYNGYTGDLLPYRDLLERWIKRGTLENDREIIFGEFNFIDPTPEIWKTPKMADEYLDKLVKRVNKRLRRIVKLLSELKGEGLLPEGDIDNTIKSIEKNIPEEGSKGERRKLYSEDGIILHLKENDPRPESEKEAPREQRFKEIMAMEKNCVKKLLTGLGNMEKAFLPALDSIMGVALTMKENNDLHLAQAGGTMEIRNALSPFYESAKSIDMVQGTALDQFAIMGPNKSGKTAAIRTIQAIVLLARKGYPVPATCSLPGYDKVLTFFGAEEIMSGGQSYFNRVAQRLAGLIDNATKNSLILMDELHGSDYWELSALQAAIARYLTEEIGATVILNTHMREGLIEAKKDMKIKFLKTDYAVRDDGTIDFKYTLSDDRDLLAKSLGIESVKDILDDGEYLRAIERRKVLENDERVKAAYKSLSRKISESEGISDSLWGRLNELLKGCPVTEKKASKYIIAVPSQVLRNAPDLLHVLKKMGSLAGKGTRFEIVVTGANNEDLSFFSILERGGQLSRALGVPENVAIRTVSEDELNNIAGKYTHIGPLGYDPATIEGRVRIVKDMYFGTLKENDYMLICTDIPDKEGLNGISEILRDELYENLSIFIPDIPGEGQAISLSRLLNGWFVGLTTAPSRLMVIPSAYEEMSRGAMQEWENLRKVVVSA